MIETALAALGRTPGLLGGAVYDLMNQCLGHTLRPPYDPVVGAAIVEQFGMVAGLTASIDDSPPDALVLETDAALVLVKGLASANMLVLAQPNVNVAMLHVACNSVALKLAGTSSQSRSISHSSAPQPVSWAPRQATSVTRNVMGSISAVTMTQVPPDAVGSAFVRHVLRVFSKYAGDQAKFILRDELLRMGVRPQTLRKSQVADFIDALGESIPSRRERRRFRAEALGV